MLAAVALSIAEARNRINKTEDFLAELTKTAYEAALKHGIKGDFTNVYFEIWRRLRIVVENHVEPDLDRRIALSA